MPKSYDPFLVAVSASIALWGAYYALRLGGRAAVADSRARPVWVITGALALGIGIWSMHFIAMLALRVPVAVTYRAAHVMVSMLIAIGASAAAFAIVGRESLPGRSLLAAVSMGVAISGMHYSAMAGMRLPAHMQYDAARVALSIGISFAGPLVALHLLPRAGDARPRRHSWSQRSPALLTGLGIVGMHYTAMAALRFTPVSTMTGWSSGGGVLASPELALVVALGTAAMLAMAELGVLISRHEEEYLTQLRALTARIESARERERTRIAREIHDQVGQALTALQLDMGWLRGTVSDRPDVAGKAAGMSELLKDTLAALGRLAAGLRPPVLDQLGLRAAVRALAEDFESRTGVHHHVDVDEERVALDESLATNGYRIVQEAVTNVARHAGATRVDIVVRVTPHDLVVEVRDNGRGITEQQLTDRRSLGLLGMQERARSWGGDIVVTGGPSQGTTVRVIIPLGGLARRTGTP